MFGKDTKASAKEKENNSPFHSSAYNEDGYNLTTIIEKKSRQTRDFNLFFRSINDIRWFQLTPGGVFNYCRIFILSKNFD